LIFSAERRRAARYYYSLHSFFCAPNLRQQSTSSPSPNFQTATG
jgi:hypothetical protein